MGIEHLKCRTCGKMMEIVSSGVIIRNSKDKKIELEENVSMEDYSTKRVEGYLQKGDKWKCSKCRKEIWIGVSEICCGICNRTFGSLSLYYGHIDEVESGDRCRECHRVLDESNYNGHYEGRPSGDTEVGEFIVTGYKCICGYEEEW